MLNGCALRDAPEHEGQSERALLDSTAVCRDDCMMEEQSATPLGGMDYGLLLNGGFRNGEVKCERGER